MGCVTGQGGRGRLLRSHSVCGAVIHKHRLFFFPRLTCHTVQRGAAPPGEAGTSSTTRRQSATIGRSVPAHAYLCLLGRTGVWRPPTTFSEGHCIDASHAGVTEETENGSGRLHPPTRDVDVHDAGTSPDAVGGVTDVRPGQVVGHRPLEEQGVVLDLHVAGQGAVQAVARETGNNTDAIKRQNYTRPQQKKKKKLSQERQSNSKRLKNTVSSAKQTWMCVSGWDKYQEYLTAIYFSHHPSSPNKIMRTGNPSRSKQVRHSWCLRTQAFFLAWGIQNRQ